MEEIKDTEVMNQEIKEVMNQEIKEVMDQEIKELAEIMLSEKEKKYQEIMKKKADKKRLTLAEKIFLKEMEVTNLKIAYSLEQKKEKMKWIKGINKVVKPEYEKLYDKENKHNENLDLEIATAVIYAVEHYKEIIKNVNFETVARNKKNQIVRVKREG